MTGRIAPGTKAGVGRADLLACLGRLGEDGLDRAAGLFGFAPAPPLQPTIPVPPAPDTPAGEEARPPASGPVEHRFDNTPRPARFWHVVACRQLSEAEVALEEPEWLRGQRPLTPEEIKPDPTARALPSRPLLLWSRLWPFLKAALGAHQTGGAVDLERAVAMLATGGRPLTRLPRLPRLRFAPTSQLLLDFDHRSAMFWSDFRGLATRLARLRGGAGLAVLALDAGPGGRMQRWQPRSGGRRRGWQPAGPPRPYRLPEPGSPVLVLSDLGYYDASGRAREAWLRFGRRLRQAGLVPTALSPTPPRRWDPELAAVWRLASWDRGVRLPRLDRPGCRGQSPRANPRAGEGWEQLLALLSPAVSVEPPLLRAMRLLLPQGQADVGSEAEAWLHPHVLSCLLGFFFADGTQKRWREDFRKQPARLRQAAGQLIRAHHAHLPPVVRHEEELLLGNLAGENAPGEAAQAFVARTVKTLEAEPRPEIKDFVRRQAGRQHASMWRFCEPLAALWILANKEELQASRVELPPGLDLARVAWVLDQPAPPRDCRLWQQGPALVLTVDPELPAFGPSGAVATGSLVGSLTARRLLQAAGGAEKGPHGAVVGEKAAVVVEPLPSAGPIVLRSEVEEMAIDTVARPAWAAAMGRDRQGLFVEIGEGEASRRAYWLNPGRYPVEQRAGQAFLAMEEGAWLDEAGFRPLVRSGFRQPPWAERFGVDPYGVWAEFQVKGVWQRMRWIRPGRFLMGSPEDEPERDGDEQQHEVILTRAFWLADTACTQALWKAVMGRKQLSQFRGDLRPMESVSWDQCMDFVRRINKQLPGLGLRLPFEAEWEYACRAGTTTPFSFGATITPEQVNYDGNYPYAGGRKGLYRNETVEVGSLPANPWGLFEMHGNVWEWCSDWYGDYPTGSVVDPEGSSTRSGRVLRGGSWVIDAWRCRSAYRYRIDPANRYVFIGFRLARGQ
ncbi:MAG: formylglycine-generating enzyme family protein [Thermodesulfobacteriota bacterium]